MLIGINIKATILKIDNTTSLMVVLMLVLQILVKRQKL